MSIPVGILEALGLPGDEERAAMQRKLHRLADAVEAAWQREQEEWDKVSSLLVLYGPWTYAYDFGIEYVDNLKRECVDHSAHDAAMKAVERAKNRLAEHRAYMAVRGVMAD